MNENAKKERLLQLLTEQAIFGLSSEEFNELKNLEQEFPELANDESFEITASAVNLSSIKTEESMPESLKAKILADADKYFSKAAAEENLREPEKNPVSDDAVHTPPTRDIEREILETEKPGFSFIPWLGWGVAALACIALVANIWVTRIETENQVAEIEPSVAEQKQQLLTSAKDIVKTNWSSPQEGENLSGEVVWSDSEQKGFMTFRGLPANDPNKETYQLWIFDETQDEKTPINGGVFDVNKDGEVIVPIAAELKVKNPQLFAVTVEKPGGVVVSKREKIVAVAKV